MNRAPEVRKIFHTSGARTVLLTDQRFAPLTTGYPILTAIAVGIAAAIAALKLAPLSRLEIVIANRVVNREPIVKAR
jgi:hypothetical protein